MVTDSTTNQVIDKFVYSICEDVFKTSHVFYCLQGNSPRKNRPLKNLLCQIPGNLYWSSKVVLLLSKTPSIFTMKF